MKSLPSRYDKSYRSNKVYEGYRPNKLGKHPDDWWPIQPIMPSSGERIGYPTQKPLALLEQIIKASSNEGDMVLDPFAGCATACVSSREAGPPVGRHGPIASCLHAGSGTSGPRGKGRIRRIPAADGLEGHAQKRHPAPDGIDAPKNYRQHKHVLYGQQEGRCGGCDMDFPFKIFEVDHVVPQSRGGGNHIENPSTTLRSLQPNQGRPSAGILDGQLKQGVAV